MYVANAVLEEDHSYVCKFREINEKFLSLLPKLEIYIPTVAQLNDPLEGVLTEGYAVSCNPPPVKSDVESYLQTVGVYSVSIHKQKMAWIQLFADVGLIRQQSQWCLHGIQTKASDR